MTTISDQFFQQWYATLMVINLAVPSTVCCHRFLSHLKDLTPSSTTVVLFVLLTANAFLHSWRIRVSKRPANTHDSTESSCDRTTERKEGEGRKKERIGESLSAHSYCFHRPCTARSVPGCSALTRDSRCIGLHVTS